MNTIYLSLIEEIQSHLEEIKFKTPLFEMSSASALDYFHSKSFKHPEVSHQDRPPSLPSKAPPIKKETSYEKNLPAIPSYENPVAHEQKKPYSIKEKSSSETAQKSQTSSLHKEPTQLVFSESFDDIRRILHKINPHMTLLSDLPSDAIAKDKRFQWKKPSATEPFVILSPFNTPDLLLKSLAHAITTHFAPCGLLILGDFSKAQELKDCLPSTKLVLTTSEALQSGVFRSLYKEIPQKNYQALEDTPLFMLADTIHSLQDGTYKKRLWEQLCLTLPQYLK